MRHYLPRGANAKCFDASIGDKTLRAACDCKVRHNSWSMPLVFATLLAPSSSAKCRRASMSTARARKASVCCSEAFTAALTSRSFSLRARQPLSSASCGNAKGLWRSIAVTLAAFNCEIRSVQDNCAATSSTSRVRSACTSSSSLATPSPWAAAASLRLVCNSVRAVSSFACRRQTVWASVSLVRCSVVCRDWRCSSEAFNSFFSSSKLAASATSVELISTVSARDVGPADLASKAAGSQPRSLTAASSCCRRAKSLPSETASLSSCANSSCNDAEERRCASKDSWRCSADAVSPTWLAWRFWIATSCASKSRLASAAALASARSKRLRSCKAASASDAAASPSATKPFSLANSALSSAPLRLCSCASKSTRWLASVHSTAWRRRVATAAACAASLAACSASRSLAASINAANRCSAAAARDECAKTSLSSSELSSKRTLFFTCTASKSVCARRSSSRISAISRLRFNMMVDGRPESSIAPSGGWAKGQRKGRTVARATCFGS
mmetsp:Transcript_102603/g.289934  ORF Transcript_102603/g.289934 Transcript_102603/m.289934 type:complete len:503 (-) Transcript_102603:13-1521(-)